MNRLFCTILIIIFSKLLNNINIFYILFPYIIYYASYLDIFVGKNKSETNDLTGKSKQQTQKSRKYIENTKVCGIFYYMYQIFLNTIQLYNIFLIIFLIY